MQLAFIAAGGAAGAALGGTTGLGWGIIGAAALYQILFPPKMKQVGPRQTETLPTESSFGKPVPIGYGTCPYNGNYIWDNGLEEVEIKEESGKGGSVESTYYVYYLSFAVHFSAREAKRLVALFMDGEKVYDVRSDGNEPTAFLANKGIIFRFYTGSATQERDPLIESIEGTNNTPAYRGHCYGVFERLKTNHRTQVTAIVAHEGSDIVPKTVQAAVGNISSPQFVNWVKDPFRPFIYITAFTGSNLMIRYNTEDNTFTEYETDYFQGWGTGAPTVDEDGYIWVRSSGGIVKYDPGTFTTMEQFTAKPGSFLMPLIWYGTSGVKEDIMFGYSFGYPSTWFIFSRSHAFLSGFLQLYGASGELSNPKISPNIPIGPWVKGIDQVLYGVSRFFGSWIYRVEWWLTGTVPQFATRSKFARLEWRRFDISADISEPRMMYYYPDEEALIIFGENPSNLEQMKSVKWDIGTEAIVDSHVYTEFSQSIFAGGVHPSQQNANLGVQDGKMMVRFGTIAFLVSAATLEIIFDYSSGLEGHNSNEIYDAKSASMFTVRPDNIAAPGSDSIVRTYFDRFQEAGESLKVIVDDIGARFDLDNTNDVDASALPTITSLGFPINQQMTGIDAIRILEDAYHWRLIESEWKLKAVLLGGSSVFSINADELGLMASGEATSKRRLTIGDEKKLPRLFNVTFLDKDKDYQLNSTYMKRDLAEVNTRSIWDIRYQVVMDINEARSSVEKWLFSSWTEQKMAEFMLTWESLRLDPEDIGTISDGDDTFTVRLTDSEYGDNMALLLKSFASDAEDYIDSDIVGDPGLREGTPAIDAPGFTEIFVFDTNILRNPDAPPAGQSLVYYAMTGYSSSWNGGAAMYSIDRELWSQIGVSTNEVTWGFCTTVLNNDPRWSSIDRFGTLTVHLFEGSLSSITWLQLLNYGNVALVQSGDDWEVIQFQTAVDNGDNTYTLSDLLRGRLGTDPFVDGHSSGDRFFLLDVDTFKRFYEDTDRIGSISHYRGVSFGSDITESIVKDLTVVGNSWKPWTVTFVKGSRDGSNNLTGSFYRRKRYAGRVKPFNDFVDTGEESESYEVDVLDGPDGSVLRTITDASTDAAYLTTFSYPAADQTTDGLTPGDDVTVEIHMMSAVVGRGHGIEVTI